MSACVRRLQKVVCVVGLLCATTAASSACGTPKRAVPTAKLIVIPNAVPAADTLYNSGMNWIQAYMATETRGAGATSATAGR